LTRKADESMPIDFDKLGGDRPVEDVPVDGVHKARLERAVVVTTKNGDERLVTEWSNESNVMWTSWNRFDAQGLPYTQDLLDGLGIDRKSLTDEVQLGNELASLEGGTWTVTTESNQGSQGDRWFTSTYVEGKADPQVAAQAEQKRSDIPADVADLPEPGAGGKTSAEDLFGDDAPFHHEPFGVER
jgi:hypothetical protein